MIFKSNYLNVLLNFLMVRLKDTSSLTPKIFSGDLKDMHSFKMVQGGTLCNIAHEAVV